ncbi:response regulator transcription factor [Paenibacillus psychroresistens]|uniref:response regulator transcription factor n=1 Tax=Paenibacillus psychroresistens TaxID=1778678 RepID=UPI001391D30E|nr:response regulator [Paenibacillus psychroresistens]
MFRLFIVDDNKYERTGIKNSIDWTALGIEVVGVFANGAEAIAQIEILQPHIVITDIAMPVMNGIEMSEHIKKSNPDIKIIFISCHSDFEFARSAVDLGIYGYVLKPILSDELVNAIQKLLNEFAVQNSQQVEKARMMKQLEEMLPLVQEQFLKELLLGDYRNKEEIVQRIAFLKLPIEENANIYVISIKANDMEKSLDNQSVANSYLISYSFKGIIRSFETEQRKIYPVQISGNEFVAIAFDSFNRFTSSNQSFDQQESIINASVEINMEISRRLNLNTTMGISKCSSELSDIALLYKQSQKAVNTRFYSGSNPIIIFEEIEDHSDIPFEEMPNLQAVYQDVKALMSFGNDKDIQDFIDKYLNAEGFRTNENYIKGFSFLIVNLTGIILMEANHTFKDIYGDDIMIWEKLSQMDTKADVVQWIHHVFMKIKEHLIELNPTKNVKMVETIKEIIKSKYQEQIKIEDISKSVFLSGRHANALFKKETGKTIFDYIIQIRIEMAKKLLKETDSKVAAIAEIVGYLNTSYFCLAFKKNVGMTPAEYKSKVILR